MAKLTFSQVEEMKRKGLTDERIAELAQDRGYELPNEGIIGSIAKPIVKYGLRAGEVVGAGIAKLAGADMDRVADYTQRDKVVNLGPFGETKIEGVKPFGQGGEKQIAGDTLEAGAMLTPLGRATRGFSALTRPLGKTVSRFMGPVGAGATAGYAFDVSQGLIAGEDNPYTPGAGTALGAGIPAGAQLVSPVLRGTATAMRYGIGKISGLDPETVTTVLTRPQALTDAQRAGIDRYSLATELQDAFKGKLKELSQKGDQYNPIRLSSQTMELENNIFRDVLRKRGLILHQGSLYKEVADTKVISTGSVKSTPNSPIVSDAKPGLVVNLKNKAVANLSNNRLSSEVGEQVITKQAPTITRTPGKDIVNLKGDYVLRDGKRYQKVQDRFSDGGTIVDSAESLPLSQTDIRSLERFYTKFGSLKKLSGNAFLNLRSELDQMADWEAGATSNLKALIRQIRYEYDQVGKRTFDGLADADAAYSELVNTIKSARKSLFDKDGNLLESAVNRIANIGNQGRELTAQKLEKVYPGITQKAQIVKVLEDIDRASGQKVGTYTQAIFGAGGGWLAGGPIGAFAGLVLSSPAVVVPILKTFGRVNGYKAEVINRITGKLVAGKPFTDAEMMLFRQSLRSHLENISPGDQFLDSNLGKKMTAIRPGMNVQDITERIHPEDLTFIQEMSVKLADNTATPDDLKVLAEVAEGYGFQLPTARTKQASVLKDIVNSISKRKETNAEQAFMDDMTKAAQQSNLKPRQ